MIDSFGASDVGRRRKLNEDTFLVNMDSSLYIVADGMGGHNAGEIASQLAVETVADFVQRTRQEEEIKWPYGLDLKMSINANRLLTSVLLANKRVWDESEGYENLTGMGTTIVAALTDDEVISLVSAGDSRAYRLRRGKFEQLTVDDSWVQAAVDEGVLLPEEAESHPMKNVITKAIGVKEDIDLRIQEYLLEEGDLYLMCSDGLHGMISNGDIEGIVKNMTGSLEMVVKKLIDAANELGGKDNITVLAISYETEE